MRLCFYTNIISPHQIPWCKEAVALIGAENFRYVYSEAFHAERASMGWSDAAEGVPCLSAETVEAQEWAENADQLVYDGRDIDLFERRASRGLKSYCAGERWFKPIRIGIRDWGLGISVPGWVRLFVPSYWRMARRFRRLLLAGQVTFLPTGIIAAADMVKLVTLRPCNPFALRSTDGQPWHPMSAFVNYPWMRMWGYFVAPSSKSNHQTIKQSNNSLKVLWVGRMLALKHVDTIIRAVMRANEKGEGRRAKDEQRRVTLALVGDGPEKSRLKSLAGRLERKLTTTVHLHLSPSPSSASTPIVSFLPSCPIAEVRRYMREHDVYVFSSNGFDGWGAVVSEAVAEGMYVLGSSAAGASATVLPREQQFSCGDWRRLSRLLRERGDGGKVVGLRDAWSARSAAEALIEALNGKDMS